MSCGVLLRGAALLPGRREKESVNCVSKVRCSGEGGKEPLSLHYSNCVAARAGPVGLFVC